MGMALGRGELGSWIFLAAWFLLAMVMGLGRGELGSRTLLVLMEFMLKLWVSQRCLKMKDSVEVVGFPDLNRKDAVLRQFNDSQI